MTYAVNWDPGERYAWEYLWSEWYRFDQWCRWGRSADREYFPVIQTNATVESHWSVLKYKGLKWFNRPRIDHLCATIHEQLIPIFAVGVDQVRMRLKPAGWYKCMITDWRELLHTVRLEDLEDDEEEGLAEERFNRMDEVHHTNCEDWSCTCVSFIISPYHICKHLVRFYGPLYPSKGKCFRQRTPPLLWIEGWHEPELREIPSNPSQELPRQRQRTTSLAEIRVMREDLELISQAHPQRDDDLEDPRSGDTIRYKMRQDLLKEADILVEYLK
jgi:hypothetical protein